VIVNKYLVTLRNKQYDQSNLCEYYYILNEIISVPGHSLSCGSQIAFHSNHW